ncbi:unnamed protein product [Meloidogyne enterolobii]|uniref:Uncharacterized protein n=1 Tax=Meloidogyne enterolobii TaxID=390850 RepID=A0ACB1A683_MELEN
MSKDQKIMEHEGTKYYKEGRRWYRLVQIEEDSVPADIKNKTTKISFPQETQLDILKCLNFNQLVSFQQSSFYFKNFIDKYGKELAKKKFAKLKFRPVYDVKWEKNKSVKVERKLKFVEIEPHNYNFELSKQLKEKWKQGIDESIPMFLTMAIYKDIDIVVCELQQNYNDFYYLQLPKFPKNMKEMAIARFVFQLLFNCAFEYFEIFCILINPQIIEVLFDKTNNIPLQIHSQNAMMFDHFLNFTGNYLYTNKLTVRACVYQERDNMDFYLKLLTEEENKFSNITYDCVAGKLYNLIIKHIETAQDVTKMVKQIKFKYMCEPRIPSETEKNIRIDEASKTTKFQLSNKHNPKIKFSVTIKEPEENEFNVKDLGDDNYSVAFKAVIKRIN